MKKVLLFIALVTLITTSAFAEVDGGGSFIGMFADADALTCAGTPVPFAVETYYIYAAVNSEVIASISAAEFRMDNFPPSDGYPHGTVAVTWSTQLVIGSPWDNIALAWTEAQEPFTASNGAALILLGTVTITSFDAEWLGTDLLVEFIASTDSGLLALVDADIITYDVVGGQFTFNGEGDCHPGTAIEASDWSRIKSLY